MNFEERILNCLAIPWWAVPTLQMHPDGILRVGQTRVTLDTVIAAFTEGVPASEIVDRYPSLQLADVYFAIGYYLRHKQAVDAYLTEREKIAAEIRQEAERRFIQWAYAIAC